MRVVVAFSVFYPPALNSTRQDSIPMILPRFRGAIRLFWPVCLCACAIKSSIYL